MKRMCLALPALVALTGGVAAADLTRPLPPAYYPPPPPVIVPLYNWTGFYIGVNGGGGFGNSNWDSTGGRDVSGWLAGATAGYNFQFGQAVLGVEGDIDWTNINGSTTNSCPGSCETSNTWLSTVRGRLGYAADRFMHYITGGAVFGNIRAQAPGLALTSTENASWTVGAGLETAPAPHWTAKVEYLYVDLGSFNCGLNCGSSLVTDNVSLHTNILRAGLNYRF